MHFLYVLIFLLSLTVFFPQVPGKGYFPSFPATSPYVTAVGATMGPESGDPEIACQSQLGGVITTGEFLIDSFFCKLHCVFRMWMGIKSHHHRTKIMFN